jgi:outer membrane protein assembly factor BamB
VWRNNGQIWLFAADTARGSGTSGTSAWTFSGGKLNDAWKNNNPGTSPVVAGGMLFVYDPSGHLRVYDPAKGTQIADLECGAGHWNSPIVIDGKIALPEGSANQPSGTGVLDIWSVAPAKSAAPVASH